MAKRNNPQKNVLSYLDIVMLNMAGSRWIERELSSTSVCHEAGTLDLVPLGDGIFCDLHSVSAHTRNDV